jgi:uncharacterized membrane protein YGL010W
MLLLLLQRLVFLASLAIIFMTGAYAFSAAPLLLVLATIFLLRRDQNPDRNNDR